MLKKYLSNFNGINELCSLLARLFSEKTQGIAIALASSS